MALVLITHNMGVVAETAQRVVVMYAGQIMEERSAAAPLRIAAAPLHGGPARRAAGAQRRRPARDHPRRRARPLRPPARLPVQPALRLRHRAFARRCRPDLRPWTGWPDPLPLSARRPAPRERAWQRTIRSARRLHRERSRRRSQKPRSASTRCAAGCSRNPVACRRSAACRFPSSRARRSRSSANPVAANPRSPAW